MKLKKAKFNIAPPPSPPKLILKETSLTPSQEDKVLYDSEYITMSFNIENLCDINNPLISSHVLFLAVFEATGALDGNLHISRTIHQHEDGTTITTNKNMQFSGYTANERVMLGLLYGQDYNLPMHGNNSPINPRSRTPIIQGLCYCIKYCDIDCLIIKCNVSGPLNNTIERS